MMDDLAALRLLLEWGADEALTNAPVSRLAAQSAPELPSPVAAGTPAQPQAGPRLAPLPVLRVTPASAAVSEARALASAAATPGALHTALDGFHGCQLRATATNTVRPSGNPAAGLVLVAEAPGPEDDRSGEAFSGRPGQVLDGVLASIGLDRSSVLLTHLVPWRPPGNRAPSDAEVQVCLPFLRRLLALVQPRLIVLLGAAPARTLAGTTDSVRRLRGRWLPVAVEGRDTPAQALPLLPLDQWMRSATTKRHLWADLLELRQSIDASP